MAVFQQVNSQLATTSLITGFYSYADTKLNTIQGEEIMTVTITPNDAANVLYIEALIHVGSPKSGGFTIDGALGLFQDSTAEALAATGFATHDQHFKLGTIHLKHIMAAGTTMATTFKLRGGSRRDFTVNGARGSRIFGGNLISTLSVIEYT